MFDTLVESNKRGRRDVRGTAVGMFSSASFQAVVLIGAVYATMSGPAETHTIYLDTTITFDPLVDDSRVEEQRRLVVAPLRPLDKGFKVLAVPSEIPTEIPPIDLETSFEPRNYTGVGVPGGVFDGIEGTRGPVHDLVRFYEHDVVDKVPERISCPVPAYPRMMQQAKIEGQVLLQFIVETDGHVLDEHIETISSSHRAFETPAKQLISNCLFRPGLVRTQRVRVLVQMPVIFALGGQV